MVLDQILAHKRHAHTLRDPITDWDDRVHAPSMPAVRSLASSLSSSASKPAVIAEFKRRSPSAGDLLPKGDVRAISAAYAQAGAAAISVLTDEKFFGGKLADLSAARAAERPILRKDFVLFDEDLVDARIHGADAVLLIARILDDATLGRLLEQCGSLGLEALVEVHNDTEWTRAVGAGARMIGVNHRDLDTLQVDLELSARVGATKPSGVLTVAESGLRTADDLRRMRDRGFDAVLIGESLLSASAPGAALADLIAALS